MATEAADSKTPSRQVLEHFYKLVAVHEEKKAKPQLKKLIETLDKLSESLTKIIIDGPKPREGKQHQTQDEEILKKCVEQDRKDLLLDVFVMLYEIVALCAMQGEFFSHEKNYQENFKMFHDIAKSDTIAKNAKEQIVLVFIDLLADITSKNGKDGEKFTFSAMKTLATGDFSLKSFEKKDKGDGDDKYKYFALCLEEARKKFRRQNPITETA